MYNTDRIKGGWGIVAKGIMRNKELSPESKCIYAYLTSFTDENSQCFPSRKLMLNELGMSENRFSKYMKELTDAGIVEIKKTRDGNIFGHNIYTIHHEITVKECNIELTEGVKSRHSQNESVGSDNENIQSRHSQNGSAEMWSAENLSTNKTSFNKTSFNNTSIENKSKSKRFTPPTLEEVQAYCKECGYGIDSEQFIDFYSSKDWMIGKNKMKDWKSAVRTWERRNKVAGQTQVAPVQEEPIHYETQSDYFEPGHKFTTRPDDPFQ